MPIKWEIQEKGWHTSGRGGIVREQSGWWFFPVDGTPKYGPFRSLAAAKLAARSSPADAPQRYLDMHKQS
jgi:hypothetical protein